MLSAVLAVALLGGGVDSPPDTVVVCPAVFQQALGRWLDHRIDQGHRIAVISAGQSSADLCRAIRRHADGGALRAVVLVGDTREPEGCGPKGQSVPTCTVRATVNVRWGSEPEIATDNEFGDLDDDGVPEVAVGRIPADSVRELADICARIIAYERNQQFGPWRRRVHFVAGTGGFGAVTDAALELAARALITGTVPQPFTTTMTYASRGSVYCPAPNQITATAVRRFNEGCLFWVYIGHGHHLGLSQFAADGLERPILATCDVTRLNCRNGSPVAVLMACYAGAFDACEDCLAEEMFRHPGGPVAVIAGSRVTMPYGMAVLGAELLAELLMPYETPANGQGRAQTLGEAILRAKRAVVIDDREAGPRAALDLLARTLSPTLVNLTAERLEHIRMFNLIGDPLLRLHHPRPVTLRVPATAAAGSRIPIAGSCDITGRCTVELAARPGRLTFTPPERHIDDTSASALTLWQQTYERANDPNLGRAVCLARNGQFATELDIPDTTQGTFRVRVFIEGDAGFAVGAAHLYVERPRQARGSHLATAVAPNEPHPSKAAQSDQHQRHAARFGNRNVDLRKGLVDK